MSVRKRIILANTIILTAVMTSFGYLGFRMSENAFQSNIENGLVAFADQLEAHGVMADDEDAPLPPQGTPFFFSLYDIRGEPIEKFLDTPIQLDLSGDLDIERRDNYFTILPSGDYQLYILTVFVSIDGQDDAFLRVARYYDGFIPFERIVIILGLTGLGAVTFSMLLGAVLLKRILWPLRDMAAVALRIHHANDLSRRLPDLGDSDEIGHLALVLNQTLERVETLFRTQQRLLTDVSHELRTPLTTIRGNIELIRRMGGPPDLEMLNDTQEEVARMTRLVDDLMLLARADAGGLPIQRKPVELDTVFLDVFRRMKPVAECVELSLEGMDQVCVLGDADRLKQLIMNLVDNGLKYTPPGGRVSMSLSKLNGVAQVVVADNGIGIDEGDLGMIFERFYRADKARTRIHGGSGLGLSIVRWLVEAHGGQISVKSKLGEGTTFVVTLPVYVSPAFAAPRPSPAHNK